MRLFHTKSNRAICILCLFSILLLPSTGHTSGGGDSNGGDESGEDSGFFGGIADAIGDALGAAADAIGDAVGAIGDTASDALGAATDFGKAAFSTEDSRDLEAQMGVNASDVTGQSMADDGTSNEAFGISDSASSPSAAPGTSNSENQGAGGDRPTAPQTASTNLLPDLRGIIGNPNIANDQVTFNGQITNIGKAAATAPRDSMITSNVVIDYDCDGTIDRRRQFTETFSVINAGESKDLSVTLQVPVSSPNKTHCYAVSTDPANEIREVDERNNRSTNWRNFAVTSATLSIPDPQPSQTPSNTSSGFGSDVSDTITNSRPQATDITLEVRALVPESEFYNSATGQIFEPVGTGVFSRSNITIQTGQQLSFRWNAPGYSSCNTDFTSINGSINGSTEDIINEKISGNTATRVPEPAPGSSRTYNLVCTKNGQEFIQSLTVTAQ